MKKQRLESVLKYAEEPDVESSLRYRPRACLDTTYNMSTAQSLNDELVAILGTDLGGILGLRTVNHYVAQAVTNSS